MEHNISIIELISLELYLGSISFIIGTLFFIIILQKLRLKKIKILLYTILQIISSIIITSIIHIIWNPHYDIMFSFIFLPNIIAEVITISSLLFIIKNIVSKLTIHLKDKKMPTETSDDILKWIRLE